MCIKSILLEYIGNHNFSRENIENFLNENPNVTSSKTPYNTISNAVTILEKNGYIKKENGKYKKIRNYSRRVGSIGESITLLLLEKYDIIYKYQKYLKLGDQRLYIDFIISKENKVYWLEVNGKQHYYATPYFCCKSGKVNKCCIKKLIAQNLRDKLKKEECKKRNNIYISINYRNINFKYIENVIMNKL